MAAKVIDAYGIGHPAPHRDRVSAAALTFALLAAPVAWGVQLSVNYALSSQACFPREHMRALPGSWHWLSGGLLAINLAAVVLATAGALLSWRIWRDTNGEAGGGHTHLIHAGEGRSRFLAVWGIWSSVWFLIMIGFDTVAVVGLRSCGS